MSTYIVSKGRSVCCSRRNGVINEGEAISEKDGVDIAWLLNAGVIAEASPKAEKKPEKKKGK